MAAAVVRAGRQRAAVLGAHEVVVAFLPVVLSALLGQVPAPVGTADAPAAQPVPQAPLVAGERPAEVPVDTSSSAPLAGVDELREAPPATAAADPSAGAPTIIVPPATGGPGFFDDGQPGHYLAWYGAEYAVVAGLAGLYFSGVTDGIRPNQALIGPRVDLDNVDVPALMDPRLDDVIGRPFLKEKVPTSAVVGGAAVAILGASGIDLLVTGDLHRTNGLVLGGLEAMLGTVLLTEVTKLSFGRLRPDFRDRYLHAACGGNIDVPAGLDCSGVDDSFSMDQDGVEEGMKSFVSGHSSGAFAAATFTSWWVGSTLVWNPDAPDWGPTVGALGIGGLMATAGVVAATRLSDNKHHPEDVIAGSVLGATVATSVWLVHFDLNGRARRRSFSVVPVTAMGASGTGSGLALIGTLP